MMAYLTRPKFKDGTPLEKDFPDMSNTEIIETTQDQTLIPPKKPGEKLTLNEEIEALKKVIQAFEPQSQVYRIQRFYEKALESISLVIVSFACSVSLSPDFGLIEKNTLPGLPTVSPPYTFKA